MIMERRKIEIGERLRREREKAGCIRRRHLQKY